MQPLHPAQERGATGAPTGVQPVQARGAAVAPEPYKEPSQKPAAPEPAREEPHTAEAARGGGSIGEFFNALGGDWRLTAAQRARLAPVVATALSAGLGSAHAGGRHWGEHRRSAEPVRGFGGAARAR